MFVTRVEAGSGEQLLAVMQDVTARQRREAHLAFLAEVSADFAPLASAEELMRRVGIRLARHLNLSRCDFRW
ncbi:MAG: hypothetical protein R3E79_25900 [Caldilineaceae bacterium]